MSPAGNGTSSYVKHLRAREICPPGPCELCGSTERSEVHHRDGDYQNNDLTNLQRLCGPCHRRHHHAKASKPCTECDREATVKGFCQKHYLRVRAWGDPHLVNAAGRHGVRLEWRP